MASSRLFKKTRNTNWDLYRLHTVYSLLFPTNALNPKKVNEIHDFIGVGALSAPLSATYFAQSKYWSCHFLISLFLATWNIILLAGVFRFQSQDGTSLLGPSRFPKKKVCLLNNLKLNLNSMSTTSWRSTS